MRVLLIEDEIDLAETISDYLTAQGIEVDHAYDGLAGLHLILTAQPDVVVLDIGLPGLSGLEVCEKARRDAQNPVPILMLTARDGLEDKITGFEKGADDYLVKPFAMAELVCRLQALLRRGLAEGTSAWIIGELEVDPQARTVRRDGQPLHLSKLEFDLLAVLCEASPNAVSKSDLARRVWGEEFVGDDVIRAHIYQLRRIIDRPFSEAYLHTLRGFGHALRAPVA